MVSRMRNRRKVVSHKKVGIEAEFEAESVAIGRMAEID